MANLAKIEKLKKSRVFMIWDIPVFLVIIALTVGLLIAAFAAPAGDKVAVYIKNEKVAEYSLKENIEKIFTSKNGNYSLTLKIEDKKVSVYASTCPDKLCQKTRPIIRVHDSIVCLPAYIVIKIVGKSDIDGAV